jgi:hypothetical protein
MYVAQAVYFISRLHLLLPCLPCIIRECWLVDHFMLRDLGPYRIIFVNMCVVTTYIRSYGNVVWGFDLAG